MRGPDRTEMPLREASYLEIVENQRIISTDAYSKAWEPSDKPFITIMVTIEDEGGNARYTTRARHWTVAHWETHQKMGFHEGRGKCAGQFTPLVVTI
jgi:uncharacterized protein YndB with AHSA1/START domain